MVKRPRQHQLEDESRIRFADILPSQWVYRDKAKDYGIDCEVEIFDEINESTGLVFLVQLKGTDSEKLSKLQSISLRIETINYYKSLELPVLIARYSSEEKAFLVKWAHEIDTYYAKEGSESYTIKYTNEDRWEEATPKRVVNQLKRIRRLKYSKILLPISAHLLFREESFHGIPSSLAKSQLLSGVKQYSDFIVFKRSKEESLATVNICSKEISIEVGKIVGYTLHTEEASSIQQTPNELAKAILFGLAICFSQLGKVDSCAEIIFESDLIQPVLESKEQFLTVLPIILKTPYFSALLEKVGDFIEAEGTIEPGFYTCATAGLLFNSLSQKKKDALEKLLCRILAKSKTTSEPSLIGIAYYNLGRHLGNSNKLREAIASYLKAKSYFPNYLEQAYFNKELGGLFFEVGKYRFSSYFYKKALEQNCQNSEMLYADSLMFSGQYLAAQQIFERGLSVKNYHSEEWSLKLLCLSNLTSAYNIDVQSRDTARANQLAHLPRDSSDKNTQHLLDQALKADFLCSLAWFNLGRLREKQGEYGNACFCYLLCSLINREDIEAWTSTFLCGMLGSIPEPNLVLILRTAFKFNQEEYLEELYRKLQGILNDKLFNQTYKLIETVISEVKQPDKQFEIRAYCDNDDVAFIFPKNTQD